MTVFMNYLSTLFNWYYLEQLILFFSFRYHSFTWYRAADFILSATLGSVTWILFLHSNLSSAKSSNRLQFFNSILTITIHVPFGLSVAGLWWTINLHRNSLFGIVVGLCWTCPTHLKWISVFIFYFFITQGITTTFKSLLIYPLLMLPLNAPECTHF